MFITFSCFWHLIPSCHLLLSSSRHSFWFVVFDEQLADIYDRPKLEQQREYVELYTELASRMLIILSSGKAEVDRGTI